MKYNKNEVTGKMRDRIILQNVNRSRSLTGFASESWVDVATIWAFAESKLPGSNETIIDGKNTAKNVCDFTIRYISTITEESRVVWGDKLYQVKNLKVSHDRRFISFTGVFYDSYILTGVNVASSVNGIATTSANLKLIMSVIGQANAIASSFADLTVFQQGTVDVAASVNALGNVTANLTKVININSSVGANANISAPLTISKNITSSVDATATSVGDVQLVKLLSASVNANATATSILDVVTQGTVLVDASVTATGEITANISRIVTLESSSTTAAETSATAILTKVLEANATASAETSADAQITIPVNASATATAETSANAQLTYTVNASADATAQTSAEAQIVRIISAEATAMAESSAEASFGVTFVANVNGTATITNASIARTATLTASITGQGTTAATITTVDNVAASVTGAATVTGATLDVVSPLLLDLYPNASVAYSARKLRTAYTGSAIRVRRSSDNTEQDIGFDSNGNLNESALTTFVGANNGFVVTWYDQSGNAKDATQTTAANQPQIVSSGSVIKVNNTPSIEFPGTHKLIISSSTSTFNFLHNGTESTVILLAKRNNDNDLKWFLGNTQGSESNIGFSIVSRSNNRFQNFVNNGNFGQYPITNTTSNNAVNTSNTYIYFNHFDSDNATAANRSEIYINNGSAIKNNTSTSSVSSSNASFNMNIGGNNSLIECINGSIKEIIIYNNNKLNDRSDIMSKINTYYGVY